MKAGSVPLTVADFLIRNTNLLNPTTSQRALDRICESGFYSHWLDPEHITHRWFLTNYNRVTAANKRLSSNGVSMIFSSESLAGQIAGQTTIYYSRASFRLYHQDKRLLL